MEEPGSRSQSTLTQKLMRLSQSIQEILSNTPYSPPESSNISIKLMLEAFLPKENSLSIPPQGKDVMRAKVRDFSLCCSALASAEVGTSSVMSWIPKRLSVAAKSAFQELSESVFNNLDEIFSIRRDDLDANFDSASSECKLAVELLPDVLPMLKASIKESAVDSADEEISAASARPVASAILAAHQFRWLVTQVTCPYLGKFCGLVFPCALTALDHWSPAVKGQAMLTFIHLGQNVKAADIGLYEEAILDACHQNIAVSDEIWQLVVEMSVLLVTLTQQKNPRSIWFERILSEMLSHLARQPKNTEHRIVWLQLIEPVFNAMGLVLLAHFRRIFPLFFWWMHVDDDETVILVLERLCTIIKLTWVRNTPYIERMVDELATLFKESAVRKGREEIRLRIRRLLVLLQQCKGQKFETALNKLRDDPNLTALVSSFLKNDSVVH